MILHCARHQVDTKKQATWLLSSKSSYIYIGKRLKTYNFKVHKVYKRCQGDKSTVQRISATGSQGKIRVVLNDHEV